jgi:two-component system, NtrC family, nitrogen regulation sensor histidine kinase GlnL
MSPAPELPIWVAFDSLATMVAVVGADGRCRFANSALEGQVGVSRRVLLHRPVAAWLLESEQLAQTLERVARNQVASARFDAHLKRGALGFAELPVHVIVSQLEPVASAFHAGAGLLDVLVEMLEIEQQARLDREERQLGLAAANKELVRNLAHEIKNPLGGIRGAAQLLEMDLPTRELIEYTQVIIREADRLQLLVDRLLDPHRRAQRVADVNVHEVCERVRALILLEFPRGLAVRRDYDTSLPELRGDREQLIQAVLNVTRNAAQALEERIAQGDAEIVLRTRAARQVTFSRQRHRLALELHIQDNGPGVPEVIRERIFQPLVSGRDNGTGLGLTLAQSFVEQHQGTIECDSHPGRTVFKLVLPLP